MSVENCPNCGQGMTVTPELAGRTVKCPACRRDLVLPAPAPLPTTSPPPIQNFRPARRKVQPKKSNAGLWIVAVVIGSPLVLLVILCAGVTQKPTKPPATRMADG